MAIKKCSNQMISTDIFNLYPCRRLAEDRKNYFDTMERHMFSSKQSTKGTGRESVT